MFVFVLIESRNAEMRQLAEDLAALREIMLDSQSLIVQQGEMLSQVQSNTESAAVQTSEGTKELHKASRYAVSARYKCAIIIAIIIVIIIVVVLAVLGGLGLLKSNRLSAGSAGGPFIQ